VRKNFLIVSVDLSQIRFLRYFLYLPVFTAVLSLLFSTSSVNAQSDLPDGPFYQVQEGDTLWDIALRFRVPIDELQQANGITDAAQIDVGNQLVIPGLEGIQGLLETRTMTYGETLRSLSRRYRLPEEKLARLNHLTSPNSINPGSMLVIPAQYDNPTSGRRVGVRAGKSLLELAMLNDVNPWELVLANNLPGTWSALPGDLANNLPGTWSALPGDVLVGLDDDTDGPGAFLEAIGGISIEDLPLVQGKTMVIRINGDPGMELPSSLWVTNMSPC
jgi:LysM repeat protein